MKRHTTPTKRTVAVVICATLACAMTGSMAYAATTKKKATTTKKSTTKRATVTTTPVATGLGVTTPRATTTATSGSDTTPAIVEATNAFLATLTADQKKAVSFDFTNTAQRQGWSNLPEGLFKRSGVMWGKLSDQSKAAWLTVMKTTLSQEGYDRVIAEWDGDEALAKGGGGGGLQFGKQYYWIAILGTPSTTTPWQWQWGGHHVTVNATIVGTEVSLTPSFIGVQPATFTDATGKKVRPLGDIEDEAFALINSLDTTEKKKAIIGTQIIDLVLGPGADGRKVADDGIKGSDLTIEQNAILLKLAAHYGGLVNNEDATARVADIQKNLDQTYFAWSGPTTKGSGTYFRISGPTIVAEYSGQSMGGSTAQHVHGIYRDPTNDYGTKLGAGLK
jgi:Protein of unknown function (DUF3500)